MHLLLARRDVLAAGLLVADLDSAVKRWVVRGAQIADGLDARWDSLSFALRRDKSTLPESFEPRPLDGRVAARVREAANLAAARAAGVEPSRVRSLVERNSVLYAQVLPDGFGLETYCAFRAYNALIDGDRAKIFERYYGAKLLDIFDSDSVQGLLENVVEAGLADGCRIETRDDEDRVSATLYRPAELRARLLLENQSRRLQLAVLPDLATTLLRAYYRLRRDLDPQLEEYFLNPVYRTQFDPNDYTFALQIEIILASGD